MSFCNLNQGKGFFSYGSFFFPTFYQRYQPIQWGKKRERIKCICEHCKVLVTQSCLILCNPVDCILTGSCVHGIFQARILEWVAISFSRGSSQARDQAWFSHIGSPSMEFYRQEYWSGLPCPPPGDLPDLGMEPTSLMSPTLADRLITTSATCEAVISTSKSKINRH